MPVRQPAAGGEAAGALREGPERAGSAPGRPAQPRAGGDRTLGWAGVRLRVPSGWEVTGIGGDYLLLGEGAHPRLELKSAPVRGAFHLDRQLRRLERRQGGGSLDFQRTPVPPRWHALVEGFQAGAFAWRSASGAGSGLLLFCPCCRRAILVQFHHPLDGSATADRVLASLGLHPLAGWNLVALYDIRGEVPEGFRLQDFRFAPGHFRLAFAHGPTRLTFQRWAPADVLLRRMDLEAVAQAGGLLGEAPALPRRRSPDLVEWAWDAPTGRGIWDRLRRRPPGRHRLRLWHAAPGNRLLAVGWSGAAPDSESLFAEVCRRYALVPQAPPNPQADP